MAEKTIYARANPEKVSLVEQYYYDKKISRNPFIAPSQKPTGKIEIIMPYDGDQCFTRQAYYDVKKQLGSKSLSGNAVAQIGHLSFINYDKTDLRDVLGHNERYGSIPITIPVLGQRIATLEHLYSDTLTSKITFNYSPNSPSIPPIEVSLQLWDEDTLNWSTNESSDDNKLGWTYARTI